MVHGAMTRLSLEGNLREKPKLLRQSYSEAIGGGGAGKVPLHHAADV